MLFATVIIHISIILMLQRAIVVVWFYFFFENTVAFYVVLCCSVIIRRTGQHTRCMIEVHALSCNRVVFVVFVVISRFPFPNNGSFFEGREGGGEGGVFPSYKVMIHRNVVVVGGGRYS